MPAGRREKPGGERDQHTWVVMPGGEVLGRDAREVGNVLGEYRLIPRDRRGEHVRIRPSRQSESDDG